MESKHTHVIVGGGFAGLSVARNLLSQAPSNLRVVLVTPNATFEYHAALYRSANGTSPLEVVVPHSEIFSGYAPEQYELVYDFVTNIRSNTKEVVLMTGKTLHYDTLTLALGYSADYFNIPGMADFSYGLYGMSDALRVRQKLCELVMADTSARVAIVGAGPTGLEVATAIEPFMNLYAQKVQRSAHVTIDIYEASASILPGFDEDFVSAVSTALAKQPALSLHTGVKIAACDASGIVEENGTHSTYDCVVWTAGTKANSFFEGLPHLFDLGKKGRVHVNENLLCADPNIYIAGDSADTPWSGTAYAAIEHGKYIALDVLARLHTTNRVEYQPSVPSYVIPTGPKAACAKVSGTVLTNAEGWQYRRELDLLALQSIMPSDAAYRHWQKGEQLARFLARAE